MPDWKRLTPARGKLAGHPGFENLGCFGMIVAIVISIIGLVTVFRELHPNGPGFQPFGMAPWVAFFLLIGVAFLIFIFSALLFAHDYQPKSTREDFSRAELALAKSIKREVVSTVSAIANNLKAEEFSRDLTLSVTNAPRLIQLDGADIIDSEAISRCLGLISSHETSAVGISGPRGVGKTTIMRRICQHDPKNYLGVYIPAPALYDPVDFLRFLNRHVAIAMLDTVGSPAVRSLMMPRNLLTTDLRRWFAIALLISGVTTFVYGRAHEKWPLNKPTDAAGLLLIICGLSLVALTLQSSREGRIRSNRLSDPVVALCELELDRLHWTFRVQRSSKNSLNWRGFGLEDVEQVERSDRQSSHPEMVIDFKAFLARYSDIAHRSVIVAIDELDKIGDSQAALQAINNMKDLFHGEGTHFLVSVSEDALANFSLRGIPVRDAFDSSFDEILSVTRFTAVDSVTLLRRRVVGFPDILSLFCHSMGGGLPRDLIRAARQCVLARREEGIDLTTSDVVRIVVRNHVAGVMGGAIHKLELGKLGKVLMMHQREVQGTDPGELQTAISSCIKCMEATEDLGSSPEDNLSFETTALHVYAAILDYFSRPRTRGAWSLEQETGMPVQVSELLAGCVADLAVNPMYVHEELDRLEEMLRD